MAIGVFSVALAGVFPAVTMMMRLAQRLDARMAPDRAGGVNTTHYLVPPAYAWNARCGPAWIRTSLPDPPPRTIDDTDPTVRFEGQGAGWEPVAGPRSYQGGHHRHEADPTATAYAEWVFPGQAPTGDAGLPPGRYAVYVTWTKAPDQGRSVGVEVLGAEALGGGTEPALDQSKSPRADLQDFEGCDWQRLAHDYRTVDGTLRIRLRADPAGATIADAVRVVPAPCRVQLQSVTEHPDGSVVLQAQAK